MADEQTIRADERIRIAKHMQQVANDMLHDKTSDVIDGYVAAVIIDLAETIAKQPVT